VSFAPTIRANQHQARVALFEPAPFRPNWAYYLEVSEMTANLRLAAQRSRGRAAWFCLLAVLFLELPTLAVSLAAATGFCCGADRCPISSHHHHPDSEPAPMDCGHHAGGHSGALKHCSMSCCHDTGHSALHSGAFLFSPLFSFTPFPHAQESISVFISSEISAPRLPFSPPPEFLPL